MEELHKRDLLSFKIDNKIKYLCSKNEKEALIKVLDYLKTLLKEEDLLEHHKEDIKKEIDKILLYNI